MVKTTMKTTTIMRLKRSLSEDTTFPSLFLVFDAKGGEVISTFFMSLACSSLGL
jgi:hypothetical protein